MSNKLESFFKKINNNNKSKWTNASSGTEFENKIIQLLRVCGFTQYVANLNYFTNPDRKNIEEKTIKYIRETDKDKKEEPN